MIDSPSLRVRTNSGGAYRIDSVASGFHMLRFRRVGLLPVTVPVTVRANEITGVDAVLATVSHTLATVTIQDSLGELLRLPSGVADRVHNGSGTYITAADIARTHPIRTSQMLQYVAGAQLTKDGAVLNTRGVISLNSQGCKFGLPVYIDGQKIADPKMGADSLHGSSLADYVQPSDVAVIEVYRGPSELPATLPQDKCGGLFIWTKR
jgi:outer membrane receptor for ferrienterochelin and colicin